MARRSGTCSLVHQALRALSSVVVLVLVSVLVLDGSTEPHITSMAVPGRKEEEEEEEEAVVVGLGWGVLSVEVEVDISCAFLGPTSSTSSSCVNGVDWTSGQKYGYRCEYEYECEYDFDLGLAGLAWPGLA